jgi:hypothetical protein
MVGHRAIGVHREFMRGRLLSQFVDNPCGTIRVRK